jgi:hypothetical protein
MKKALMIFTLVAMAAGVQAQNIFLATGGKVSLFSSTPLENIDATTESATSVITTSTNGIQFTVPMRTFKFKKSLMEEHFNEKYVESEKFPKSTFKGKINEAINWNRDTVATVTATGDFFLHGVTKQRTETGKLTIKDGKIYLDISFNVLLKEYEIEVPKVVTQSIAESISIKGNFTYTVYQKK